jgi:hypothetical protein
VDFVEKFLLALQALNKAISLNSSHPDAHRITVRFLHAVQAELASLHPTVQELIKSSQEKLLAGKSLEQFNEQYLQQHQGSFAHRIAAAEMTFLLNPAKKEEALKLINTNGVKGGSKDLKVSLSLIIFNLSMMLYSHTSFFSFATKSIKLC